MTRERRLELLKQIEKDIYVCTLDSTFHDDAKSCAIHSVIKELEQEPKTGRWIEDEDDMKWTVWCSECHEDNDDCSNYCPNCGARMESEGKE